MKRGRLIYDLFKEFGKETNSLSCYYVACVVLILLLQLKVIHSHFIKLICRLNSYHDIELTDNNIIIYSLFFKYFTSWNECILSLSGIRKKNNYFLLYLKFSWLTFRQTPTTNASHLVLSVMNWSLSYLYPLRLFISVVVHRGLF